MIDFLADENFDRKIVRGVRRSDRSIRIDTVPEVGLRGATDQAILEYCAERDLVLLTHDRNTMIGFARQRTRERKRMSGLIVIADHARTAPVIETMILMGHCDDPADWMDRVEFLPW